MNRTVVTCAERARAQLTTAHRPAPVARPPARLPLPLVAALWRPASASAPGVFAWRSWRWPLNTTRCVVAIMWPRRCTGHRHRLAHLLARIAWTLTAAALGLAALAAAAVITAAAVVVWVAGHMVGVGLILAGWFPPVSTRHLDHELAALTSSRSRPSTSTQPPAASLPIAAGDDGDPWDFNDRNDPWLALERARVDELRRFNNNLTAGQPSPGPAAAYGPAARPAGLRAARTLLAVSLLAGLAWFTAVLLLGLASTIGTGTEPPTFEQIHAHIEAGDPTATDIDTGP